MSFTGDGVKAHLGVFAVEQSVCYLCMITIICSPSLGSWSKWRQNMVQLKLPVPGQV